MRVFEASTKDWGLIILEWDPTHFLVCCFGMSWGNFTLTTLKTHKIKKKCSRAWNSSVPSANWQAKMRNWHAKNIWMAKHNREKFKPKYSWIANWWKQILMALQFFSYFMPLCTCQCCFSIIIIILAKSTLRMKLRYADCIMQMSCREKI